MFKIITIPYSESIEKFDDKELIRFSANKKIISYKAEMSSLNNKLFWSIFVEYESLGMFHSDNKEEFSDMDDNEKELYKELKIWRKEKAKTEAVSVYIVSTNEILYKITKGHASFFWGKVIIRPFPLIFTLVCAIFCSEF